MPLNLASFAVFGNVTTTRDRSAVAPLNMTVPVQFMR